MNNTFLQKYGAYLFALILFVALGYIYCKPVLSGKVLQSSDDVNAISALQNPGGGERSWWNGSMFSGMPAYQIGGNVYKSTKLIAPIKNFLHRGPYHPAWFLIFYFICFFVMLRCFDIDKWLAIVGAIALTLSSYFIVIIAAGHGGKTIVISYISLVVGGFYLIFRKKKYALGAIFTMFFTAIGFSMHPQMAYYMFMMIGLFFIAEFYLHAKEKRWKDLGIGTLIFAVSLLIGLGTGASNIFANSEYARETMRGGHSDLVKESDGQEATAATANGLDFDYATQWSYGLDETFTFLIPGFMGGSSNHPVSQESNTYKAAIAIGASPASAREFCKFVPLYWGEQPFTSGNVYMGAIICFLFLLGCLIVPGPYKWALLASTMFSVMLAWGYNFRWLTELFFYYFPLYNKFRAVSSILIVAEIAMPLLGFLAIKQIMEGKVDKEKVRKSIYISAGVTAGICLFFALFGTSIYSFTSPNDAMFGQIPEEVMNGIIADRAALMRSDSWRSFFFILAGAGVIFLYNERKIKTPLMIAALGVLILADMWPVDKRYLNDNYFSYPKNSAQTFAKLPWEEVLLQDPDPHFRVMNLTVNTFNEARTSYYLKSIGGYHAAKLRRYQDLINVHLSKVHLPVIGMLNAKYLILPGDDGNAVIQQNPRALGNAWYVGKIHIVDTPNQECDALNTLDLETEAVTDRSFAPFVTDSIPGISPEAHVALTSYSSGKVEYACSSPQPGTIVFSEIYYPYGWKASIDGQRVDHYRVNYVLRALNVPAGEHHITFVFDPDSVRKGDILASVCILLMYAFILAAAGWGIYRYVRQRKDAAATH